MATLYELTADYLKLLEMAEDPDVDADTFSDTLEGLDYELEDKAEGYAKVIRQLTADSEAYKAEIARLEGRKKTIDNNIDHMKRSLESTMIATNKTKFKTGLFSFNIQKNAPSVVMDDLEHIPEKYLIAQEPKIDKTLIKEDLKKGVDLNGIAHLEQSESIRIR